jgi:hypothetical protein
MYRETELSGPDFNTHVLVEKCDEGGDPNIRMRITSLSQRTYEWHGQKHLVFKVKTKTPLDTLVEEMVFATPSEFYVWAHNVLYYRQQARAGNYPGVIRSVTGGYEWDSE